MVSKGPRHSFWNEGIRRFSGHRLDSNLDVDVVIIGAGIAGLTIGYMLAKQGINSIILEAQYVGFGETSKSTAHISNALDDRYFHLQQLFGKKGARLAFQSHSDAIELIWEIIQKEEIDCDFAVVDGYLFLEDAQDDILSKEHAAANEAGHKTEIVKAPLPFMTSALRFPRQAQFHPLKYLIGLAKAYEKWNGKIYTDSKVTGMNLDEGFVIANKKKIYANHFVFATNTPINTLFKMHTKIAPYITYVNAYVVPKGYVTRALFWDTSDPYHYIRTQPFDRRHDLLIVGGEDRKVGQEKNPKNRSLALHRWTKDRFAKCRQIDYSWSGMIIEPMDSLAFIGRSPGKENVYVVTGDSGNGITHGTIAAMIIPDLILHKKNKYERLYDPSRKNLLGIDKFLKENINVAKQYTKYLKKENKNDEAVKRNEGAIIKEDSKYVAIYNDNGKILRLSPVCTHLGCIVEWNDADKTFDCPCHGSRFTCKGDVIHGPALKDLKKLK